MFAYFLERKFIQKNATAYTVQGKARQGKARQGKAILFI